MGPRLVLECVPGVLGGVLGLFANLPPGAPDALGLALTFQVRVTGCPAHVLLGPALAHLELVAEFVHKPHVAPPSVRDGTQLPYTGRLNLTCDAIMRAQARDSVWLVSTSRS